MTCKENYNLGAEVISNMIRENHPLIMVDRITSYDSEIGEIQTEKYVSANDPVFIGHFPGFKLWPGICTLEGLRQSCVLLFVMQKMNEANLLNGLIAIGNRFKMEPVIDENLCLHTFNCLKDLNIPHHSNIKMRVKITSPVFAGCKIDFNIVSNSSNPLSWKVRALVNKRLVASGAINYVTI